MKSLAIFARFWYDFIIGDDWRLALGVVAATAVTFVAAHQGANLWWILPLGVAGMLSLSVTVAARRASRP